MDIESLKILLEKVTHQSFWESNLFTAIFTGLISVVSMYLGWRLSEKKIEKERRISFIQNMNITIAKIDSNILVLYGYYKALLDKKIDFSNLENCKLEHIKHLNLISLTDLVWIADKSPHILAKYKFPQENLFTLKINNHNKLVNSETQPGTIQESFNKIKESLELYLQSSLNDFDLLLNEAQKFFYEEKNVEIYMPKIDQPHYREIINLQSFQTLLKEPRLTMECFFRQNKIDEIRKLCLSLPPLNRVLAFNFLKEKGVSTDFSKKEISKLKNKMRTEMKRNR
ncbi:MAG: hypothetical protein JXR30_01690 [Alphaproteobacteria bacterium]|nr:hypothetical protein [Alphaproteobacteria bacterium]